MAMQEVQRALVAPFRRRPTTRGLLDQKLLEAASKKFDDTGDMEPLLEFRKTLAVPTPEDGRVRDPLDWVRVVATLIMVAALFIIVYVVAIKPNPGQASGETQLVSLASGLAGIGLGWLFGTGTTRRKDK